MTIHKGALLSTLKFVKGQIRHPFNNCGISSVGYITTEIRSQHVTRETIMAEAQRKCQQIKDYEDAVHNINAFICALETEDDLIIV